MRPFLPLLIALCLTPGAAAGLTWSGHVLEGDARCSSSYEGESYGSPGHSWYWSTTSEKCSDDFDHAAASVSDDDGTLASVRAGSSSGNASQQHESGSFYDFGTWRSYHSHRNSSTSSSWWSGVSAETAVGSASLGNGCESSGHATRNVDGGASYGDGSSWGASSRSESDSSESTCGPRAGASLAGRDAGAGFESGCAASTAYGAHGSTSNHNGSGNFWETETSSSSTRCVNGIAVDAPEGLDAWAGLRNRCADAAQSHRDGWWNGEESSSYASRSSTRTCDDGVAVDGPDGITLFAGTVTSSDESCSVGSDGVEDCYASESRLAGISVGWQHGPLGPQPIGVFYALP